MLCSVICWTCRLPAVTLAYEQPAGRECPWQTMFSRMHCICLKKYTSRFEGFRGFVKDDVKSREGGGSNLRRMLSSQLQTPGVSLDAPGPGALLVIAKGPRSGSGSWRAALRSMIAAALLIAAQRIQLNTIESAAAHHVALSYSWDDLWRLSHHTVLPALHYSGARFFL
jgi:hypothetical protein